MPIRDPSDLLQTQLVDQESFILLRFFGLFKLESWELAFTVSVRLAKALLNFGGIFDLGPLA